MYFLKYLFLIQFLQVAYADDTSTAGGVIQHVAKDVYGPFVTLCVMVAFFMGFYLIGKGLFALKDAAAAGADHKPLGAILMIGAGTALISLPDVMGAGLYTFYQTGSFDPSSTSGEVSGTTSCFSGSGDMGATCAFKNISQNVTNIFIKAFFSMSFVTGLYVIFHDLLEVARMGSNMGKYQGRGEKGLIASLCFGIILCNLPFLVTAIEHTIGINSGNVISTTGFDSSSSMLSYNTTSTDAIAKYAELVGYIFTVLVMFGLIAIWRGLRMMKLVSEGKAESRATFQAGVTHIIGGALLCNMQFTTCLIMTTVWGSGNGFC